MGYDWTWLIGENETGIFGTEMGVMGWGSGSLVLCSFILDCSCRFEMKMVMGMRGNGGKWFAAAGWRMSVLVC